jgi:hypothetical protein
MSTKKNRNYHDILLELIRLRETDYDGFMDRLYEALAGEFRDVVHDGAPIDEKKQAIWTMISHFEKKEQYEKCADLKRLSEELG